MRRLTACLLAGPAAALALALPLAAGCGQTVTPAPAQGECPACTKDSECTGGLCGQFDGDTFCAPDCSMGQACSSDRTCTAVKSTEGVAAKLCLPKKACSGPQMDGGAGGHGGSGATGSTGSTGTTTTTSGAGGSTPIGVSGGKLDTLSFAIVGDTRPPSEDDIGNYPTPIITAIWKDVQAQSPAVPFAVMTGDYMFANPFGNPLQAGPMLDLYLGARAAFTGTTFPAMGNHECTGGTASNCGPGNANAITANYTAFLTKMLAPLGVTLPYYVVNVGSTTSAWTAKFVMIAANAWDSTQATWLDQALAVPTTYTFVVRHESSTVNNTPGVGPSEAIIAAHPYTVALIGHTHTFEYRQGSREVVVGNGGAPLSGGGNYGYVVARQRADGAMVFNEYDYQTNASNQTFVIQADGTPTQ